MRQDPLQIALEHHRAGRLAQAEAGYRAVLSAEAQNTSALHWLGVLLHQAGLSDEAIALLEKAAKLCPDDAGFQHNLGQAYVAAGRAADAIRPLERAAEREPARAETWVALGTAHLSLKPRPDPRAAATALRRAREVGLDTPALHHDLGVAQLLAGAADDAIESLRAAVAKDPAYASAYHHLAVAHRAKGEPKDVRKCLLKALEIDPERSASWIALGELDVEAGQPAQAIGPLRRAVRVDPNNPRAYRALSRAFSAAGMEGEARQADRMAERIGGGAFSAEPEAPKPRSVAEFERRLTPAAEVENLHIALATKLGVLPPARLRPDHIADLFDKYADRFDRHLQENLGYRIPEQLVGAVTLARADDGGKLDVFDLGCGTGLCGSLLRPLANRLVGVDLSANMLEKARGRQVYDELVQGDLVEALKARPRSFDLLVAADVMIYVGDLAPVMGAAAEALRPGGLFAFSVEAGGGDRYHLQQPIRRYAHSKPYLEHVSRIFGFELRSLEPVVVRYERNEPVPGYLLVLRSGV